MYYIMLSGSSKTQTLLPSNVIEISPQGFKFCNSVEKYQILLDGNDILFTYYMHVQCVNGCILTIIKIYLNMC